MYLLSIVCGTDGDQVFIHADAEGLEHLAKSIKLLQNSLAKGNCDHDHLVSESWGSYELSESMLDNERKAGARQVHHVKIYAWPEEWRRKYGL
jgi:hypothetical protein